MAERHYLSLTTIGDTIMSEENKVQLSKQEQLKAKNAAAKALREETKALREEVNAGKEERATARKDQAESRKLARASKSELAKLTASVNDTFKSGDPDAINALADSLMEQSTALVGHVRAFGTSAQTLKDL